MIPRLAALLLAAAGLAAAVYLHSYRELRTIDLTGLTSYGSAFVPPPNVEVAMRPSWGDPAALLVLVAGVGGAAVLLRRNRPT
jgi:hypothetical protein